METCDDCSCDYIEVRDLLLSDLLKVRFCSYILVVLNVVPGKILVGHEDLGHCNLVEKRKWATEAFAEIFWCENQRQFQSDDLFF